MESERHSHSSSPPEQALAGRGPAAWRNHGVVGAWVLGVLAVPGCSGQEPIDARPEVASQSHGRARVEVTHEGPEQTFAASVRFLSYRDLDSNTADSLVGSPPLALGIGRCDIVSTEASLERALGPVPRRELVSHLDGGEVYLAVGEFAGSVVPLRVPALHPYVTGLEYDEFTPSAEMELTAGSEVLVTGYGGEGVGPFEASTRLPVTPAAVAADRSSELAVTWDPGASLPGDSVAVVIQRAFGEPALRCRTADSGRLVVYREVLTQLPGYAAAEDLVVSVERTRRVPFSAAGLDWGELEISVRYVVIASAP